MNTNEPLKLKGTEKQISWAEDIRARTNNAINGPWKNVLIDRCGIAEDISGCIVKEVTRYLGTIESAKYFIDNKEPIFRLSEKDVVNPLILLAEMSQKIEGKEYDASKIRSNLFDIGKSKLTLEDIERYFSRLHP